MADEVEQDVGDEVEQGQQNGGQKGEIYTLPDGGAHPVEGLSPGILRHKGICITGNTHKKGDEGETDDACR